MRIINLYLFLSLFSFSGSLWAGADEILGPEPTPAIKSTKAETNLIGLTAEVSGGVGFASYNLTSSGYNVALPFTLSNFWILSAVYKLPESRFSFLLEYFSQQSTFQSVSGATPSTIGVNTNLYDFLAMYDLNSQWTVGVGFGLNQRLSTQTTPRDVISSAISSGSMVMVKYSYLVSAVDELGAKFRAFLPNYYDETSTSSGFSNSSFIFRLEPYFKKELKPNVFGSVGLLIEYNFNGFSGTGTRQTVNARESFWKIYVPLTLGMDF